MNDPYTVLGIGPGANADEVRRAWRQRALETHPDRGGDPMAFLAARDAWRRLLAPEAGLGSVPVLVRRLGPPALARRWLQRRVDRTRHPRVV
ncbi:MAG: J domain-containing protein [Actinomycetota bacterium]|nr:J domain-containing protein [Actinomycetota bacterium]